MSEGTGHVIGGYTVVPTAGGLTRWLKLTGLSGLVAYI